jgi:hypothetical protein
MGLNHFHRDQRDSRFLLEQTLDLDGMLSWPTFAHLSREACLDLLDQAHRLAAERMGPCLQEGDRQGCTREQGTVKVPASFREPWRALAEGGWFALADTPAHGGRGWPHLLTGLVNEYFFGANTALMIYGLLTVGAARLIENFGRDSDRDLFLRPMYAGRWSGTMCLTEPLAGSDVGWLTTAATPAAGLDDPRLYRIQGLKRFISGGDQDLTENIIHLVLARIAGAPQGTKGVSLFIVPKIWVNPDGSLGGPNDVHCVGLENKMGMHGSSTCAMNFGQQASCLGILLGEPHSGMAKMFQMMNEARLATGLMGLSLAASAYDSARLYAAKRVQGPPITDRQGQRVPIIQHPDVRRMLMNQKAASEGMRALIAHTYYLMDLAVHHPDAARRAGAATQAGLLTPVVKTYCTDMGFTLIRDALQCLGGTGYCSEHPVEQFCRDAKVLSVWEGTSYIQALDLVGRKLPQDGGQAFQSLLQATLSLSASQAQDPDLALDMKLLGQAAQATGDYAMRFMGYQMAGKLPLVALSATRFLECLAETFIARLLLEQALAARRLAAAAQPDPGRAAFLQGKLFTAQYFCRNFLPQVLARRAALETDDASALLMPEEAF